MSGLPSHQNVSPGILADLTPAERLVAVHLAEGLSNKEIAAVLGKSGATVKSQVSAILRATRTHSRAVFIARYYQQFVGPRRPGNLSHSPG